jgi:anaphase-promoting complex subunit 10
MYTPPAVSPRETPRSSESQASEEEDEEDEDETSQDADLGFRGGGGSNGTAVAAAGVAMADESTETADRSTTTATPTPNYPNHHPTTTTTAAAAAGVPPNTPPTAADDPSVAVIVSASNLDAWKKKYREVAHTSAAVCWELSSSKPGNGVEQLRDSSYETYWQSDGTTQPHWVQITFRRRLPIVYVALYLDVALDESYTPKTLSVETGMTAQDLSASPANGKMELTDPSGWSVIAISGPPDPITLDTTVKTHLVRINILSMHQNGRDTHIRRLAIFAKRTTAPAPPPPQPPPPQPQRGASLTDHPTMLLQQSDMMRGQNKQQQQDDDDDDDDTNLMLNSDFGGPFSMLIR